MKKIIFTLSILLSTALFGQIKFGLKISPNVSLTSVRSDSLWERNSAGMRFVGGIFADISLTDNAALNVGLDFAPKRVGLKLDEKTSSYNLQYLHLPVGLKFFTNEFADRFKIYFLIAPSLALKISERSSANNDKYIAGSDDYTVDLVKYADSKNKSAFNIFDIGLNFGVGTEMRVGESTHIFGGFSYNRGLVNTINLTLKDSQDNYLYKTAKVTTGIINLDLGIKF
ncbi:MAG TPA: outer membrane beta-barrel protein [Cytophagales bacterium]|nr:outer membrane beta-barrel protein [Cytophagales bacterium]